MAADSRRKVKAGKLLQLAAELDLDAAIEREMQRQALAAEAPNDWLKAKAVDENRKLFFQILNRIAHEGKLTYAGTREHTDGVEPGGDSTDDTAASGG